MLETEAPLAPGPERQRYLLSSWMAEKRPSGWHIARPSWLGQASLESTVRVNASATLIVARELGNELKRRST